MVTAEGDQGVLLREGQCQVSLFSSVFLLFNYQAFICRSYFRSPDQESSVSWWEQCCSREVLAVPEELGRSGCCP